MARTAWWVGGTAPELDDRQLNLRARGEGEDKTRLYKLAEEDRDAEEDKIRKICVDVLVRPTRISPRQPGAATRKASSTPPGGARQDLTAGYVLCSLQAAGRVELSPEVSECQRCRRCRGGVEKCREVSRQCRGGVN